MYVAARPHTIASLKEQRAAHGRKIARNTAIFSIATGLSRVAGMGREILASSYFGTSGPFSAFTLAFQIPNLVRSLVADAAISAAFVPVFTELLEQKRKRDASQLAATLCFLIVLVLGTITALFVLLAPVVMPLFIGDTFSEQLKDLTVGLSQVLFPIVVLLGVNGLVVGILQSHEHFALPAFAPVAWNLVIIVLLVTLKPLFEGPDQLYAYAIGVLAGTAVQLLMVLPMLRRVGFHFRWKLSLRDPRVLRVLGLMVPVTIGLGVINFDLVINSVIGSLVSDQTPRAIDAAFRIYMLPQGLFSIAVATVLFPALSRFAARQDQDGLRSLMANGVRQIFLLLLPAAALTLVLAEPITQLVYQRGEFTAYSTEIVSLALFWFSFSLPFAGVNLLLTRTFFSLQKPWTPTALAAGSIVVNAIVSLALYKSYGIAGPVIGTVVGSAFMTVAQVWYLRRNLGRLEGVRTVISVSLMTVCAAIAAALSYGVWSVIDRAIGDELLAQILSVGGALTVGILTYVALVLLLRVPEAHQIRQLVRGRARSA